MNGIHDAMHVVLLAVYVCLAVCIHNVCGNGEQIVFSVFGCC